ncbi:hypothetical protein JCM6882_009444 [Rhodosporidiobolus microsporus]
MSYHWPSTQERDQFANFFRGALFLSRFVPKEGPVRDALTDWLSEVRTAAVPVREQLYNAHKGNYLDALQKVRNDLKAQAGDPDALKRYIKALPNGGTFIAEILAETPSVKTVAFHRSGGQRHTRKASRRSSAALPAAAARPASPVHEAPQPNQQQYQPLPPASFSHAVHHFLGVCHSLNVPHEVCDNWLHGVTAAVSHFGSLPEWEQEGVLFYIHQGAEEVRQARSPDLRRLAVEHTERTVQELMTAHRASEAGTLQMFRDLDHHEMHSLGAQSRAHHGLSHRQRVLYPRAFSTAAAAY